MYKRQEWLRPVRDELGGRTARLKIFPQCVNLIRTLPALQYDHTRPNDVADHPHELTHAPDALRGFCVYWTVPAQAPRQKRASWSSDLWEDYHNADERGRACLLYTSQADGGRGGLRPCAGAASAHQLLVCGQVAVGAPGALGAARIKCRKSKPAAHFVRRHRPGREGVCRFFKGERGRWALPGLFDGPFPRKGAFFKGREGAGRRRGSLAPWEGKRNRMGCITS